VSLTFLYRSLPFFTGGNISAGGKEMRVAARMNGRLESRPTGRLESLPYESARLVFSGGEKFPGLLGGRAWRL
jgi:hypothetical protein